MEEAAEIDLKEQLMKSEEERRRLTKRCTIYQSQLEVHLYKCTCMQYYILHKYIVTCIL